MGDRRREMLYRQASANRAMVAMRRMTRSTDTLAMAFAGLAVMARKTTRAFWHFREARPFRGGER